MESDREGPLSSGGTSGGGGTCSTHMALTAMVPQTSEPVNIHTIQDQASGKSNDRDSGGMSLRDEAPSSRVAYLRRHYKDQKLSNEASDLLLASWRQKSSQSYDSLCKKWISWCSERNSDPVSGTIGEVVNFLAHLFNEGYQYRSLNAYRSAIASMHTPIDGVSIGQHPLVSRLLKGAFHSRPPLPKYSETWDVSKVLAYLDGQIIDENISLKLLSLRTVMLLALTRPSRAADLSKLSITGLRNSPEGAVFLPAALIGQAIQAQ